MLTGFKEDVIEYAYSFVFSVPLIMFPSPDHIKLLYARLCTFVCVCMVL